MGYNPKCLISARHVVSPGSNSTSNHLITLKKKAKKQNAQDLGRKGNLARLLKLEKAAKSA